MIEDYTGSFDEQIDLPKRPKLKLFPPVEPVPATSRDDLLLAQWLTRKLPPRDYLMGDLLCTTSRWLIFGDTGVGKTLFTMYLVAAASAGKGFLGWEGRRRCRVMYLDGEMPAETFKERMQLLADAYGEDLAFYGYNRDDLGDDAMPPLNTDVGQEWLWNEIETVKPDIIVFDSLMCLLIGSLKEDDTWAPMRLLVRQLTARHVAQIWLNHTGIDASHSYGDKSREWEMDTVIGLFKDGEDWDTAIRVEFTKARLRTPATVGQFRTRIARLGENGEWHAEDAPKNAGKVASKGEAIQHAILSAYERLAANVDRSPGFNGAPVWKVGADQLRDEVKNRGFLDKDDKGQITDRDRQAYGRAKTALLDACTLAQDGDWVWKP